MLTGFPPTNTLTINCDGSFDSHNLTGGIGLILRNFAGTQQSARCIYLNQVRSVEQAECMGRWKVMQWAKDLQIDRVFFEIDAKVIAHAINNDNSAIDWRLHHTVQEIKNLFSVYRN